jgi:hypothetical protein
MNQQELLNIRQELVDQEKAAIANRESFDGFLRTYGFDSLGERFNQVNGNGPVAESEIFSDRQDGPYQARLESQEIVDVAIQRIRDLSVPVALLAYAKEHNGVVSVNGAAEAFIAAGVSGLTDKTLAYGSIYYHLKKAPWVKIGPGEFRLKEATSKPSQAPRATGRDHSTCEIPAAFRDFDLRSLDGKTYKDAAILVAQHNGGTIKLVDLSKVFWHADLCGNAPRYGSIGAYIWGAVFAPSVGSFKKVGAGTYRLVK